MTYLFKCKKCSSEFEIVASIAVMLSLVAQCPSCGSLEASRVYTAPHVQFKGKGFYSTEGRKDNPDGM